MSNPHRLAAQRLSAQFDWRLLTIPDWAAAACAIDPAPADDKAARNACLSVYSRALHEACQDKKRQEQAYGELHRYLWPQAYHRDPELAADAAQLALLRIFEAMQSPDPARGPQTGILFLRFSQYILWQAIRDERRQRLMTPRLISLDQPVSVDADQVTLGDLIPDEGSLPEERIIEGEEIKAHAARLRWSRAASPGLAQMVLEALQALWRTRLEHQISAVVFTYFDQVGDDAIAARLHTIPKNVQPLRSRGLDKIHAHLNARLANGQGGYP